MKNNPVLLLCLMVFSCSTGNETENTASGIWTEDNARQHILNREDRETRD